MKTQANGNEAQGAKLPLVRMEKDQFERMILSDFRCAASLIYSVLNVPALRDVVVDYFYSEHVRITTPGAAPLFETPKTAAEQFVGTPK